jgi:hypothetical protein
MRQWLRIRNILEDKEKLTANIVVEAPYLNDVLFKSRESFTSHPGNNTLRILIESKLKKLLEVEKRTPHLKGVIKELKKALVLEIMDEIENIHCGRFLYWHKCNIMSDCWWVLLLHINDDDQKVIFSKIDYLFRQTYLTKQQQQQRVIKTKHMKQQQHQQQQQHQHQQLLIQKTNTTAITAATATADLNSNSNSNNDNNTTTTIQQCINNNDSSSSRIIIDDPPPDVTTTTTTTINQNDGKLLFHFLDGEHNITNDHNRQLLSGNYGNNYDSDTLNMSSSSSPLSSSLLPSSECFGMNFFLVIEIKYTFSKVQYSIVALQYL